MVGWGHGTRDPEPQASLEEADLSWNTHREIREHFEYPQDEEFFGDWLVWFYGLSEEQKINLRTANLSLIHTGAFPPRPHSTKE